MNVTSTAVETISTLLRLTGVGTVQVRPAGRNRPLWVWSVDAQNDIRSLLSRIRGFLTDKQPLADKVLVANYRR